MSTKILKTHLNLNQYELQNAVMHPVSSDVVSPVAGQVWYNSTDKLIKYYDGTANQSFASMADIEAAKQGLSVKSSVTAATTEALPAVTYDNGTAGVGATLTADANGALVDIDSVTLIANERLLVKNQVDASQNGIYVVTAIGDGSNPFILTRADDFDDSDAIVPNAFVFVSEGSTYAEQGWALTADAGITVGTTDLNFSQFTGAGGLTVDGTTLENSSGTIGIKDGGVATAKLADGATTFAKMATSAKPYVATFTTGDFTSGVYTLVQSTHGLTAGKFTILVEENDSTNFVNVTDMVVVYEVQSSGDVKIEVNEGSEFNGRVKLIPNA